MMTLSDLPGRLTGLLGEDLIASKIRLGELTCEIRRQAITDVCRRLRDDPGARFDQLIDLCGMDYSTWGKEGGNPWSGSRYAVIYHLMSLDNNQRIRLRCELDDQQPLIDSVIEVWPAADWFEREAFDLYGIIFNGHPDLRRLLTDYGFIGHPFRKDFPLSGQVEMRFDEEQGRVIYQPVTIEERILVPRTIRKDSFAGSDLSESPD